LPSSQFNPDSHPSTWIINNFPPRGQLTGLPEALPFPSIQAHFSIRTGFSRPDFPGKKPYQQYHQNQRKGLTKGYTFGDNFGRPVPYHWNKSDVKKEVGYE
jgi:hypothetical protein